MKTLNEILQTSNPYPSQIDEELRTTINDWFGTREVCDDDNFGLYFSRILKRDYGRYCQILRLQPDISEYDWLVDKYTELRTEANTERSGTSEGHSTLTHGLKTETTNENSHTGTVTHHHTQNEESNYDNKVTSQNGNSSSNSTRTDNTTQTTVGKTSTLNKQGYTDNQITLDKNNPQSISYSVSDVTGTGLIASGVPNLNWQYASNQNQTVTKHTVDGAEPDTEDRNDTVTNTGTVSNEVTGESENNGKDKTGYNRDETATDTYDEHKNQNSTVTNSGDDVNVNNTSNKANESTAHYEIESGRTGYRTTADILRESVNFIKSSSAWEWLEPRLEVCFMGVWDV